MFTIKLMKQKKSGQSYLNVDPSIHKNTVPIKIEFNIDEQWKKTSKLKASPSATFGKSLRESPAKSMIFRPGPGSYELNKSDFGKKQSQHKIVKNIRHNTENTENDSYHLNSKDNQFYKNCSQSKMEIKFPICASSFEEDDKERYSKISKQTRLDITDKQQIPGPGAYELSVSLVSSKKCKFSKAERKLTEDNKGPGPGDYRTQKSMLNHEGGSISRQKRLFKYQTPTPGPGYYKQISINSIKKKESFAIINKSVDTTPAKKTYLPGPGSYLKQSSIRSTKITGGVIGRSGKVIRNEDSPSPLSYSPSFKDILTKSTSVVIGKSHLVKKLNIDTPGPGHYKIDSQANCLHNSQSRHLAELVKTNIIINIDGCSKHKQRNNITKSHI